MGIKSFFSREGRRSRTVARFGKVVNNPKASGDDRWSALLELSKDGSPEAIHAMLLRYTYTAEVGTRSRVTDEQEKNLAFDLIVEMRERALDEVHKFLLSEEGPPGAPKHSISFALRILDRISPDQEQTWKIVEEMIESNEPGYERDPSRKIEILTFLGEWHKDPRSSEAVLPYLDDADEGVRFQTAETLLKQGHESCKPPLLAILEEQDESYQMRNRILSGFIDNGWVADVASFLDALDEPGLMQATESLVRLADEKLARDPLLRIAESKFVSERIKSRIAEWFVTRSISVHGMRGRMEKILPKGYKVTKKRVDRFPEAMREPFVTLAVEQLLEADDPEIGMEPLAKLIRNREITEATFIRTVEFLATRAWPVGALEKVLKKALPKGYVVGESGTVERRIDEMDEPFLTAAGDSLLDHADDDDDESRVAMIQVLINPRSDERVRERLLNHFDQTEWSVQGYEADIERRLPKEFKIHVVDHGRDFRIVRVLARI